MKNLKIRFGLFSLLTVLAVSVFLTSCQQEDILPEELTQDEIVAKMQNDTDVADLLSKTDEIRTEFMEKAITNNVSAETMIEAMEAGTFNELLETMGIDVAEYQQSMAEIQQLSQTVLNKYPSIETCESCESENKEIELAELQTMLDAAYLRGCSGWGWVKYTTCVAGCALSTAGVGYAICSLVCYWSFCG